MKFVCFGPSIADDPIVHAITRRRAEVFGKSHVIDMPPGSTQEEFDRLRESVQNSASEFSIGDLPIFSSEKMDGIALFPDLDGKTEEEVLDGSFASSRNLHDSILPRVRDLVHAEMCRNDEPALLHIDIGESVIPIYMAYFAGLIGYQFMVSFHFRKIQDGKPFRLGGNSKHALLRPLGRRFLVSSILHQANTIYVDSAEMVGALTHLFPQCKRELVGDPLSDFCFEDGPLKIPEQDSSVL